MDVVKTFCWDDKAGRFTLIVWDGERARHHKLPKDLVTIEQAEAFADEHDLGMAWAGVLHDNHGWGKAHGWKAA